MTTDRIGQLLGNYRLIRLLGQGGFADVYLGEHVHLNTQAAIKVLRTQLTSSDVIYFRNEARTIAHLEHPHIVQVLDFDVEENTPYLVMVYAPGGTLRQRHPRSIPLPAEQIVLYVKQVASALHYAHLQRLIHRDIKPENMLLGRNNELLLSDFGIALLTPSARAQSLLEQRHTSEMAGTLPYMAPEQIQGRPSPSSDQYSLGVVVYEWLCGMLPFNGSYMEVAMQHVSALPPLLREKDPTIPADVEKVVLTALAKDPQQRFASVQAFATALEQAYQRDPLPVMGPQRIAPESASIDSPKEPPVEAILHGPFGHLALRSSVVRIGRTPSNQLVINDPKVSSQHAEIRLMGQGHQILDLNSTNGTFVNEQWLAPGTSRPLNWGDMIRVGDTRLGYAGGSITQKKASIATDDSTQRAAFRSLGSVAPALTPALPSLHTGYGKDILQGDQTVAWPPFSPPPQSSSHTPPVVLVDDASTDKIPPVHQNGSVHASVAAEPPGNVVVPPVPLPRTNRRVLWLVLSITGALLLIVGSALGVLAYVNSLPTPTKTLDAFCTALQGKDYQVAYHQLSRRFQNKVPEVLFASFFANAAACTHSPASQTGSTATATLTTSAPQQTMTDRVTLVQDSSNAWMIDDDANLSGLTKTLDTYCTAIQTGDDATAYSQFSSTLKGKLSQNQFASFFPKVSSCSYATLTMTKGGATVDITTVSTSGQSEAELVSLVEDSGNTWKIDDFTNLPDKALDTFCNALQQRDYQTAYNQTSNAFQGGFPESRFANDFSAVNSCMHDGATASSGKVTANMTLGFSAGQSLPLTVYLIKDSSGTWKIDDLVNLPDQTLETFCNAVQQGDYQTAYDQFSLGAQQRISEQQFAQAFSSVSSCTHDFPNESGDLATATIKLGLNSGQTLLLKVILIKENTGDWKIDSFQQA